jgi:hypothetical protein
MTEKEIVTKNLILSSEFDRYIFEHPDIAESIPLDAQIVFLPEDDDELCQINKRLAEEQREGGQAVVLVHIGKMAPTVSRLIEVTLEKVA